MALIITVNIPKITLDLPTGNILENGIETTETTNMKTVFKRI